MPRTSGVSTSSRCLFILLSPSPIRVARWLFSRRIGEPTCWTTMVLALAIVLLRASQSGFDSSLAAASLKFGNLEPATGSHRTGAVNALERIERGANHVVGIGSALRLGNDVVDAKRFEHGAHRTTGDDTGTRNGGTQDDLAGAVAAGNVVVQRTGIPQRNADHLALGLLGSLADSLGNFTGLAVTETDATLLVTDDDERRKNEATAALHNLGHTIDVDQAIDELAFALLNVSAHFISSSPVRTADRPHGQRLQGP